MNCTEREECLTQLHKYYCKRIPELINVDEYEDAYAIFSEFVIVDQEPTDWVFLNFLPDVFEK